MCVWEKMLHENCTFKSDETSIKFPLTVRVDTEFLHRTQQFKADSQNKEPKQEVEASKIPEQIHDLPNTDCDNVKEIQKDLIQEIM